MSVPSRAPAQDDPLSPESFKARIESLAPTQFRWEREGLYRQLQEVGQPKNPKKYGQSVYLFALRAIYLACVSERATSKRSSAKSWYWEQRRRVEDLLDEIAQHDLVRSGPDRQSVVFYEPHEVNCSHGLRRKSCQAIRRKLESLAQLEKARGDLEGFAAARPLLNAWRKRRRELLSELQEELQRSNLRNQEPSGLRIDDFCVPLLYEPNDSRAQAEAGSPDRRPRDKGGVPVRHAREFLLQTLGECLCGAALPRKRACETVAEVLVYCLGESKCRTETEAIEEVARLTYFLESRWRVLRRPTVSARG